MPKTEGNRKIINNNL